LRICASVQHHDVSQFLREREPEWSGGRGIREQREVGKGAERNEFVNESPN
jgi:hypothetical protein